MVERQCSSCRRFDDAAFRGPVKVKVSAQLSAPKHLCSLAGDDDEDIQNPWSGAEQVGADIRPSNLSSPSYLIRNFSYSEPTTRKSISVLAQTQ